MNPLSWFMIFAFRETHTRDVVESEGLTRQFVFHNLVLCSKMCSMFASIAKMLTTSKKSTFQSFTAKKKICMQVLETVLSVRSSSKK